MDKNIFIDPQAPHKRAAKIFKRRNLVTAFLALYDLAVIAGSYFAALWLRFDCRFSEIPDEYLMSWLKFSPIYAVLCVFVFWKAHLYQSIWRFASFVELERVAVSSVFLGIVHAAGISLLFGRMPITYYVVGIAIQFLLV